VAFVWAAQALARSVFPVPGGPYMSAPDIRDVYMVIPFGGLIPRVLNFS
jgi:hypothetical protein